MKLTVQFTLDNYTIHASCDNINEYGETSGLKYKVKDTEENVIEPDADDKEQIIDMIIDQLMEEKDNHDFYQELNNCE